MRIQDSSVIVTGAASGFGLSISKHLSSVGAIVYALDIDYDSLCANLVDLPNIYAIPCDITDHDSICTSFEKIYTGSNGANILINNAGIMHNEPLINTLKADRKHDISAWDRVINVNLKAPFLMARTFVDMNVSLRLPSLIINITSICSSGNVGQSAYSSSKAGLEALTYVWSKELASANVRCCGIAPGFFGTNTTQVLMGERKLEKIASSVPLKRLGYVVD